MSRNGFVEGSYCLNDEEMSFDAYIDKTTVFTSSDPAAK